MEIPTLEFINDVNFIRNGSLQNVNSHLPILTVDP